MSEQPAEVIEDAGRDVAPLFRGATKPAMFFGVPTEALLKVESPIILGAAALWPILHFYSIFFAIPVVISVMIMRDLTKRDDQFLGMWFIDVRERAMLARNRLNGIKIIPPRPLPSKEFIHD